MEEMPWIYIRARIKRIWVIAESSDSACSAFPILGVAAGSVRHANNWYRLGLLGCVSEDRPILSLMVAEDLGRGGGMWANCHQLG